MQRIIKILGIIAFLSMPIVWTIYFLFFAVQPLPLKADKGVIDLSALEGKNVGLWDNIMQLNGEWEFYPGELLTPQEITSREQEEGATEKQYLQVPSGWQKFHYQDGRPFPIENIGTYRLRIIMPQERRNCYALYVYTIRSANKLFVDGVTMGGNGVVAHKDQGYVSGNKPYIVFFQTGNKEIEIVIQAANFLQRDLAGIVLPISFGADKTILAFQEKRHYLDLMIFTFYMSGLVIAFGLFWQRKSEKILLYFALHCISAMIYCSLVGEKIILDFFPFLSYEEVLRAGFVFGLIAPFCFYYYISYAATEKSNKDRKTILNLKKAIAYFSAAGLPFCLFLSINVLTEYISVLFLWSAFILLVSVFVLGNALNKNESVKIYVLYGVIVVSMLLFTIIADLMGIIVPKEVVAMLLPTFVLSQFLYIFEKYKVGWLKERGEVVLFREQINQHFIYNTLTAIGSLIIYDVTKASEVIVRLSNYLRTCFTLFSEESSHITVKEEVSSVSNYLAIEKVRFGKRLDYSVAIAETAENCLLPSFALLVIVEYAVNNGIFPQIAGGKVAVNGYCTDDGLMLTVIDDGVGISEKDRQEILCKNNTSEVKKSNNMRLINIRKRIERDFSGEMLIQSILGQGTCVQIKIPHKRTR